jgi:hypothetical protein
VDAASDRGLSVNEVIGDLPSEVIGGLLTTLILAALALLFGPVRRRLREVLIGPRLLVHVWTEVVIDGRQRRLIPWRQLVVGLGADPIYRGSLEPRLQEKESLMRKPWHGLREFMIQPLYPLNRTVALADSLFAVHVVVWNKSRNIILPTEVGRFTLLIDVPEFHVLDWSRNVFDEPGWDRSRDPSLDRDVLPMGTATYKYERSSQLQAGPTPLSIGLRHAIRQGEAERDLLAVLSQSGDGVNVSVRAETEPIPLLVKPWRPAVSWERLRHPFRTIWRRLILASRVPPVP